MDYKDKEGVHLAYTLHKATMEEHYSIEKIMDAALNDEPVTLVRYEERIEDGIEKETEPQNMIAEKKSFWEQMKGFLDQRRQEKWGGWSESAKEEMDLELCLKFLIINAVLHGKWCQRLPLIPLRWFPHVPSQYGHRWRDPDLYHPFYR